MNWTVSSFHMFTKTNQALQLCHNKMIQLIRPLSLLLAFAISGMSSATVTSGPGTVAHAACQYFSESLLTSITTLSWGDNYTTLSTENWSATAWAKPTCIVQPTSATQVQQVLKKLTNLKVQFALRSGGHMASPLAANINNGVLIDLSALDEVTYDPSSGTVTVGTGNRWGSVYSALDAYNVTVAGGRVLDVGVGGLTLGGGLSYMSDIYGLVCDNVAEHEVVLADGSLVKASQYENPDLHWALKGGGNNFGVVTSFKFYTVPLTQVWGGIKVYSLDQLPAVYEALAQYQTSPNKDPYANLDLQAATTNSSIGVLLNLIYLKPVESPAAFSAFYDIPTLEDTTKIRTLSDFLANGVLPSIDRWDWFTTTFTPSTGLYRQLGDIMTTSPEISQIEALTEGTFVVGMQPISASAVLAGRARGGNALGLQAVNQTWMVLDIAWYSSAEDTDAHRAGKSVNKKASNAAEKAGQSLPYIFMNDASYDEPVIASYGTESVHKLREVQRKYDPDQVFQTLVPGGFKLP